MQEEGRINLQVSYTYLIGPVRFTRNSREIKIYILHMPLKVFSPPVVILPEFFIF